ncbi:MAG: ABC transporter substrate-binding protein [Myxococcota bacterium]
MIARALFITLAVVSAQPARAEAADIESFKKTVGQTRVGAAPKPGTITVPYILWGGDFATFHANGGLNTSSGSILDAQGLKIRLTPGDDFVGQVRDYMSGKSPFLRGTFRMIGLASEVLSQDPRTRPVVFTQLTWSAGDHLVARSSVKTIKDLKGKTIVLQRGGPHLGMLDDILRTAGLRWSDVKLRFVDDITGKNGPAEAFKKSRNIDATFVVTPDLIALTGGLKQVGTGAEGTVKGARAVDSSAFRAFTIADVYAVRSDFYEANKAWVEKFAAGYLRAVEDVTEMRKKKSGAPYRKLLTNAVKIYGKDVLPNRDEADGLLSDCTFAGYPGNVAFFNDTRNSHGFDVFKKRALDMATREGFASSRGTLLGSPLNWRSQAFLGYLKKTDVQRGDRFQPEVVQQELEALNSAGGLDDSTIYSFTVGFEPNQDSFSENQYGQDFERVLDLAREYGGAVIAVRGHSDPTKVLATLVKAGMQKGILKRSGSPGNWSYSVRGKPLELGQTSELVELVESGAFDGAGVAESPREIMQAARNLSLRRAQAVRESILSYAKKRKKKVDATQIQAQGVGIREPFVATPRSMADVRRNTRVEFRLVGVSPEAATASDFDY